MVAIEASIRSLSPHLQYEAVDHIPALETDNCPALTFRAHVRRHGPHPILSREVGCFPSEEASEHEIMNGRLPLRKRASRSHRAEGVRCQQV
jgi:hypothetical protein